MSPPSQSIPLAQNLSAVFKVLFGNFAESQSKDFSKDAIDDKESAEDYGYLSDSDLEDDEDEKFLELPKRAGKSKVHPFNPFGVLGEDRRSLEEHEERVEKGRVIKIPDMAFVT